MKKLIKTLSKSMVDTIFKDKVLGNKIRYYYNLIGISILPMWLVMGFWILLEWIIEGEVTDSLVDNIVAMLSLGTSFVVLLVGMFVGKELGEKERKYAIYLKAVELLQKEDEDKKKKQLNESIDTVNKI